MATPTPTYTEVFWGFVGPWIFMSQSLSYLPSTIVRLARSGSFSTLLRPSALQDAWFSDFWAWAGPQVRDGASRRVVPLLHGRVHAGQPTSDEAAPPHHPPISGTVLEVGAGSGMWVHLFAPGALDEYAAAAAAAAASSSSGALTNGTGSGTGSDDNSSAGETQLRHRSGADASAVAAIRRVIGVEPNTGAHAALRAAADRAGLSDVYEIVPAGIESLAATGAVARGEVDCIVSILCLCSIPDQERNIRELYGYLRPGGRWYAYEHVRCDSCRTMVWYQALVNLFWPRMLGGCQLRRETGKVLRNAGPWSDVDLGQPQDEPWYQTVPHILGILTK